MQNVSLCGYYAWKRVCIRKCKDNFFINTYIEYVVCRYNYAKTCIEEQLKVMETIMKFNLSANIEQTNIWPSFKAVLI